MGMAPLHNTAIESDANLDGLRISKWLTVERVATAAPPSCVFDFDFDVGDDGSDVLHRRLGLLFINGDTGVVEATTSLSATIVLGGVFSRATLVAAFLGGVFREGLDLVECLVAADLPFVAVSSGGIVGEVSLDFSSKDD